MKIIGKNSVAYFLKVAIEFLLVLNILVLITLPILLNALYAKPDVLDSKIESRADYSVASSDFLLYEIPKESYGFMLGFLYFSGIGTGVILFLLRKILKNLENNIILDSSNAKSFKYLSLACFVLIFAFIIKMVFYNTFLTMFVFFVFIILGLFSLVLSEVFRQGAIIKEENELTI